MSVTHVDLLGLATSIPYANQLQLLGNNSVSAISFLSYNNSFADDILGPNVSQTLVVDESWVAFHEAGV